MALPRNESYLPMELEMKSVSLLRRQTAGEKTMRKFIKNFVNFIKEEDGPTAVEYAVMLALIVVVCLGAIGTIGTSANTQFQRISTSLGN